MPNPTKAVIYCRVSSQKQVKEGHGLSSQRTRCEEYARHKKLEVVTTFQDEGVSGSIIDRPGMQAMLKFIKNIKNEQIVVIIDDISRLARGLEAHLQLRTAISAVGGKLESPSIEFGEDSDSQLVENLLASVSQHQRQKNGEQVENRMRARVMNGYWCLPLAKGYKFENVPGHGRMPVRDEPIASILKEALEGFASGRFSSQSEVARFLDSCPGFPKPPGGKVHTQFIHKTLKKSIYAGYLDKPNWGIHLHPGKHEPLISFETWQKIQERMKNQAHAPARKDLDGSFPLRSFILCSTCGNPYTAGWSRGKLGTRYPYYLCYSKECPDRRKSIRKEKLEGEFEELLQNLRPTQDLFFMAKEMFKDLWEERQDRAKADSGLLQNELKVIENKVEKFLGRIVETDNMTLVTTYENKVRKLEEEKIAINEKVRNCGRPLKTFDEAFEPAFRFLSNPYKLWESNRLEDKRAVLKLVFAERLPYDRNEGLRTPALSLPFCLTGQLKGNDYAMVELAGIEPATS